MQRLRVFRIFIGLSKVYSHHKCHVQTSLEKVNEIKVLLRLEELDPQIAFHDFVF